MDTSLCGGEAIGCVKYGMPEAKEIKHLEVRRT